MKIERKTCQSADGVTIVYSSSGVGRPTLLFVHGGLADRSFWNSEFEAFSDRYEVIALDLAGHGESGTDRQQWGLTEFGMDVKAVVEAEDLNQIILFGNSLGGPVAVEAAILMPERVLGVVGIDTFQSLNYQANPEETRQRIEAFRADYVGNIKQMTKMLFHPDADPEVMAEAERRMQKTSPTTAYGMFMGFVGYDPAAAVRRLTVPLWAINGDLYPTNVEEIQSIKPDFRPIIMKHMGHYPMLERPEEFNSHIATIVESLNK